MRYTLLVNTDACLSRMLDWLMEGRCEYVESINKYSVAYQSAAALPTII